MPRLGFQSAISLSTLAMQPEEAPFKRFHLFSFGSEIYFCKLIMILLLLLNIMELIMKRIDLTGKRIGILTVIRRDENRFYNDISKKNLFYYKWYCKCDCGAEILVRTHDLSKKSPKKSCGCNHYMNSTHKNSKYLDPRIVSYKKLYNQYKIHSKMDGKEFLLSPEEAKSLFDGDCHYCGSKPFRIFNVYKTSEKYITKNKIRADLAEILVNGIDRINSNVGYIDSNVVSCCSICNYAKHKRTCDDFFIWLNDVANHNSYYKKDNIHIHKNKESNVQPTIITKKLLKSKLASYTSRAKKKKIIFDLSKDEFKNFILEKCRYCGSFSRYSENDLKINGIDRVDSNLGYIKDNCAPCCRECNLSKISMPEDNFFKWIDKILKYQGYEK
jgi:hypothetical protein